MTIIRLTPEYTGEGLDVAYHRNTNTLVIGGWYDTMVGIEGQEISMADFLRRLKIPKKAVLEAYEEIKRQKKEEKNRVEEVDTEEFMDVPSEFIEEAKALIEKHGKNVFIEKNDEIGEDLYSVTIVGTSFWLASFETMNEACAYCDKWELQYDRTEAEIQATKFDDRKGYWG